MLSKFLRSKVAAGAGDLAWDRVFGVFRARGAARYGSLGLSRLSDASDIPTLASTGNPGACFVSCCFERIKLLDGDTPTPARSSAPTRTSSGVTSTRSSDRARLDVMPRLSARKSTVRYLCVKQACGQQQVAKDGPMTLEQLAGIVEGGLKQVQDELKIMGLRLGAIEDKLGAIEDKLGAIEDKLGHIEEFQVRSQVAIQYGIAYVEQRVDDCIINLVEHVPSLLLPTDPVSPDKFSQVTHTARWISKKLIADGVPEDFLNNLLNHLNISRTQVMKTQEDGSTEFDFNPIREHKLVTGQWSALDQLQDFFELKNNEDKADLLKSCKGPGVLLMVFKASPQAIFKKNSLALYNTLEFDFQGKMNMFVDNKVISGTIEVGEGKSSLEFGGAVDQLALLLNVLKLVLEMSCMHPVHAVKIGRLFVPKAFVKPHQQNHNAVDSAREQALKKGFNLHLHFL